MNSAQVSSAGSARATGRSHVPSIFRVSQRIVVRDVAQQFEGKKIVHSTEFFSQHDPSLASFKLELGFGHRAVDTFSAFVQSARHDVWISKIKFVLRDEGKLLKEVGDKKRFSVTKGSTYGWNAFYKPVDAANAAVWRVTCEFTYETVPQAKDSSEGSSCSCSNQIQEDLLRMLEEPTKSDVTFLVEGKMLLAHKAFLSARSKYFQAMFGSDMKENASNEIDIQDAKPDVFKGLLQFLYSGLPPKNLSEIAMDLLVVADKYCVDELKGICEAKICEQLDASNVIDALLVADKINNEALMGHAKNVFRGHIDSIDGNTLKRLEGCPHLLLDLMVHYCKM